MSVFWQVMGGFAIAGVWIAGFVAAMRGIDSPYRWRRRLAWTYIVGSGLAYVVGIAWLADATSQGG